MTATTKIFEDPMAVAAYFAAEFADWVQQQHSENLTIALSGGTTPKILFQHWASQYADTIDWSRIHFFWGDERCVPPNDSDSNYGVAKSLFLDSVNVPEKNVHRVLGESDPVQERLRYEQIIRENVDVDDSGIPQFDLVILGMGDDGHTASIFPHESQFLTSQEFCEVATHPDSGQKRITLTGTVLNHAKRIVFLVTGDSKANVLSQVLHRTGDYAKFPAAHVQAADVRFYLDVAAAKDL